MLMYVTLQHVMIALIKSICLSCSLLTIIVANNTPSNSQILESLKTHAFKIRTQQNPERFRILENIHVSGSAQFSSQSLKKIIEKIREKNQHPIVILDVRQEMHLLGENDLSDIIAEKDWSEINQKLDFIIRDEEVLSIPRMFEREEKIAHNCALEHVRIPVTDDSVPTHAEVDTFLEMYKEKTQQNPDTWFHVHCEHGHGRTTTFMTILHILNTQGRIRLSDILSEQHEIGGADLAFPPKQGVKIKDADLQHNRYAFLEDFHQYVNDNENGFPAGKSWSEWKQVVSKKME